MTNKQVNDFLNGDVPGTARHTLREQREQLAAQSATIEQLRAQVEKVINDFESAAHSGNDLCEFCGADCVDAGAECADTFQCGMFKYKPLKP